MQDGSGNRVYCEPYSAYSKWDSVVGAVGDYSHRPLEVLTLPDGICIPARRIDVLFRGGVCNAGLNFMGGLDRNGRPDSYGSVLCGYAVPEGEIERVDEDVVFGGVLIGHFGHVILDCLGRLWHVAQHPEDTRKIVFFVSASGFKDFFYDFFDLLGIDRDRVVFVERPTRFRSVTLPEEAVHSYGPRERFHENLMLPYRLMAKNAMSGYAGPMNRKVYLTYRHYAIGSRTSFGEEYFERFFASQGYEIVAPEQLPLVEQIQAIASADEIACPLGTLSHFALFARPGTKFTMLVHNSDIFLGAQAWINECSKVDWTIVDVAQSFLPSSRNFGPVLVGPTDSWSRFVADEFGCSEKPRLSEAVPEYLHAWATHYSGPSFARVANWNAYDAVNKVSQVALGHDAPESLKRQVASARAAQDSQAIRARAIAAGLLSETDARGLAVGEIHVANEGWLAGYSETGQWRGVDAAHRIEALVIRIEGARDKLPWKLTYAVKVQGTFQTEVPAGQVAGTTGKSLPIQGLKVQLDPETRKRYHVEYRVGNPDKWSRWQRDGEEALAPDTGSEPVTRIEIQIVK